MVMGGKKRTMRDYDYMTLYATLMRLLCDSVCPWLCSNLNFEWIMRKFGI